jgi:phage FluMu protein Com
LEDLAAGFVGQRPFFNFSDASLDGKPESCFGVGFKLVYLVVLGDAMLIAGVVVYVLSVQRFYLPGKVVWYRCPFCNKDWRSSGTKALVHCPHCRQLVHPTMIEKIDPTTRAE